MEENNNDVLEIRGTEPEIRELDGILLEARERNYALLRECEDLGARLREMEEKYEREVKKVNLLEVENTRNLDEIKSLRKEKNELLSRTEKVNQGLIKRIAQFIGKA